MGNTLRQQAESLLQTPEGMPEALVLLHRAARLGDSKAASRLEEECLRALGTAKPPEGR